MRDYLHQLLDYWHTNKYPRLVNDKGMEKCNLMLVWAHLPISLTSSVLKFLQDF